VARRGDEVDVFADLTIRGVTKPVVLRGEVSGPAKDPWGQTRIGFSLSGELDREDFGLTWNQALETGGVLVSRKVKLELEAQFIQG
jgi:polyisoprenoid-binding protein YceI